MKGYFSNELAAANCYNYWAIHYFGEYACLNEVHYMSKEKWENYRYQKNKTSQYRGVSFVRGEWWAQICHERKNMKIGSFDNEKEAALEYNNRAIELKGDKAKINIIT